MSAASPKAETARDASGHEPSMEEILASIRRIIADDQAGEAEAAPAPMPLPAPTIAPAASRVGNGDVLDLADVARPLRRPLPAAFAPASLDVEEAVDFAAPAPPPRPVAARPAPQAVPQRVQAALEEQVAERLVSKTTDESVGQAFGLLAHTVLTSNTRTLEDLVKDMLRPMLKAWLDDNLPVMVERLVRIEIERVARGR